jgi:hypothetical protein
MMSVLLVVACGARTGLDVPVGEDASVDATTNVVEPIADARPDAPPRPDAADARPDVVDASRDADADVADVFDAGLDACIPGRFDLSPVIPELVFVIDRSGSMRFTLDGRDAQPGEQTRWEVLEDAFSQVLPSFEGRLKMGAKFYPDAIDQPINPGDECISTKVVEVPPQLDNAGPILATFPGTRPFGGTPTASAIDTTVKFLNARTRSVSKFIVLATDGAPNCNPNLMIGPTCVCTSPNPDTCQQPDGQLGCLDRIEALRVITDGAKTIPIYVLGLGGNNEALYLQTLEDMAVAGGRPKAGMPRYYSGRSGAEIRASLEEIERSVTKCTFTTPSAPDDPDAIDLTVGGQPILRDPTRQNGWDWIDRVFGQIALFGAACDAAQQNGGTTLSATVRCKED